jgi:hypothetical protein
MKRLRRHARRKRREYGFTYCGANGYNRHNSPRLIVS